MSDTPTHQDTDNPYQMTLSLNVLNHLGLNLYSNVPSVLSETVANSWDADAEEVTVDLYPDEKRIVIEDDGHGMSREEVNNRYLHVGYRRRDEGREKSEEYGRDVMGRKGIGKLSLFSIANVVEVYTTRGEEKNAFRMEVEEIKEAIEGEDTPDNGNDEDPNTYQPTPVDQSEFPDDLDEGTQIVLKELKKEIHNAAGALRKRLARRFSIIGPAHNFEVEVNGTPIEVTDRDYFHKLQFIWTYGDGEDYGPDDETYEDYCDGLDEEPIPREPETPEGREVKGWIGTVEKPNDLEEQYGNQSDDLNRITLIVRGKMAKENLLDDFNDSRLYTKYLVGEIRADFLDLNARDDIATSDREGIVTDDERYQDLKDFLRQELRETIRQDWDELRDKQGSQKARELEVIDDWFDRLDGEHQKEKARKLFGKINKIATDSEEEKTQLFKFGVMAFERLRYKDNLSKLEEMNPQDLSSIDDLLVDLNDLEATLYYQIVKQRIEAIHELDEAIGENYKEKVLQKHLFNNLWLLDPSWERATESQYMESTISTDFEDELPDSLTGSQKRGRIDIKYRKATGRHVIIELKRPGRTVSTPELMGQGDKYRTAMKKVLKDRNRGHETVEVVFVTGDEPSDWETGEKKEEWKDSLKSQNMRVLQYATLLEEAEQSYKQYLNRQKEVGEIAEVIDRLETSDLLRS